MSFLIGRAGSNPSFLNASKSIAQRNIFNSKGIKRNYSSILDVINPSRINPQTPFSKIHRCIIFVSTTALGCYSAFEGIKAGCKDQKTLDDAIVIGTAGGIMMGTVGAVAGRIGGALFPLPVGAAIYWSLIRRSHS